MGCVFDTESKKMITSFATWEKRLETTEIVALRDSARVEPG